MADTMLERYLEEAGLGGLEERQRKECLIPAWDVAYLTGAKQKKWVVCKGECGCNSGGKIEKGCRYLACACHQETK
jgi:hypothetical protein